MMAIRLQVLALLLSMQPLVAQESAFDLGTMAATDAVEPTRDLDADDFEVRLAAMQSMEFAPAGFAQTGHAQAGYLQSDCPPAISSPRSICVPKETSCPHWFALIDYLYWQTDRQDLGYAILDPAGAGVPSGGNTIQSLDLGSRSGLRTAIGRQCADGWILGFTYTHLDSSDSQTYAPGGGQVLAVQSSPATGLTNADSVVATGQFDYDVFDLNAGRWFTATDSLSLLFIGGVRFASIDQSLRADYDGGAFVNGMISAPTSIDSFGGRVGSSLEWNLFPSLSFLGSGSLSLNAAEVEQSRYEENASAVVIDVNRTIDTMIPAADVSLAARYSCGQWNLGVGYEWTTWFGGVRPLAFADSFNGGTLSSTTDNLGLHGIFVTLTGSF